MSRYKFRNIDTFNTHNIRHNTQLLRLIYAYEDPADYVRIPNAKAVRLG